MTKDWSGTPQRELEAIAKRYEATSQKMWQAICKVEKDGNKRRLHYLGAHAGICIGVAIELQSIGCPADKVDEEVSRVVNLAAKRELHEMPAAGSA